MHAAAAAANVASGVERAVELVASSGVGVRAEPLRPLTDEQAAAVRAQLREMRSEPLAATQRAAMRAGTVLGMSWQGVELLLELCDLRLRGDTMGAVVRAVVLPLTRAGDDDAHGGEDTRDPAHRGEDLRAAASPPRASPPRGCALLELLLGVSRDGVPLVGRVSRFHSYAWAEPLQSTLRALRAHLVRADERASVYLWWDIFCQSQWEAAQVERTFDVAVSQCDALLLSVPDPSRPIATSRVWVLFEVMSAVVARKPVDVLVNPLALGSGAAAYVNDDELDVRRAQATRPEDRAHILALVRERVPGGAQALNEGVRRVVVRGFLRASMRRRAAAGFVESARHAHELRAVVSCELPARGGALEARGLPATSGPAARGVPLGWTAATVATPLDATAPLDRTAHAGRALLCVRGGSTFAKKATAARDAGAVALIIINEQGAPMPTRVRANDNEALPVVMLDSANGEPILRACAAAQGGGGDGMRLSVRYEHNDLGGVGIHGETIKALQRL